MERRARVISAALFSGLLTIVVGAGLTWACTGPTFGTPATPGNPPAPAPDAGTPGPGAGTAGGVSNAAPLSTAAPATGTSGSGVTSGARSAPRTGAGGNAGAPARGVNQAPVQGVVRRGAATQAPAPSGVAGSQFADRARGATAGVARSDGRPVFASPAAKAAGKPRGERNARSAPSARSASGDLWNGFKPQSRSSVFAAEASAAQQGGGAAGTAALVILGLGLVGLIGSVSVLGLRRRKAEARAAGSDSSSGTTEM